MPSHAIEVNRLSKSYRLGQIGAGSLREDINAIFRRWSGKEKVQSGEFRALSDVSFTVDGGEVLGIVGANGAGKSTLLKILSRITEPTSGSALLRGRCASLLEVGTGFHPDLTGRENVYLNGAIMGLTRADVRARFDQIVEFSGVSQFIDTPVKRYSSGMHVRLGFAVAAHLEPDILIVDEVLAVGDAVFREKCMGRMREASRQQGRTVIFVSHDLPSVRELCHRGIYLEHGQLLKDGTPLDAISAYLAKEEENEQLGRESGTRFINCELRQDSTEAVNSLVAGPQASLTLDIEVQPNEIPYLGLGIVEPSGRQLYSTVAHDFDIQLTAGKQRFEVKFVTDSLKSGSYRIVATLWGENGTYDHREALLKFEVMEPSTLRQVTP
ncbi:MAG: ABC transporter ATP-binding protein, partial [Puniceicoccales bacterium]